MNNSGQERRIPFTVKVNIFFGGLLNKMGIGWLGIGLIFYWVIVLNADASFIHFQGEIVTVPGIVQDAINTQLSELYETHYNFTDKNGRGIGDVSYSRGRWASKGDSVTVEYPKGKPQYSRIQGMRRKMFGPYLLLFALIPLAGLLFLFLGIKKALRVDRLLRKGVLAKGQRISKENTGAVVNDKDIYKFTFRFKDTLGREVTFSEKTDKPHLLEDDEEESLIYQKDDPENAVLLNSLPGSVCVDEAGRLLPCSLGKSILLLIPPLLVVLGHGTYLIFFKLI